MAKANSHAIRLHRSDGRRAWTLPPEWQAMETLARHPLLTAEEEFQVALRAHAGDEHARKVLVESNMRLVIAIARHYRNCGMMTEDLVQEGAIGLVTASTRFDPGRGYRFSTYATHWIRQSMNRAIEAKGHCIRLPAHVMDSTRRISMMRAEIQKETGQDPTVEELGARLGMPGVKVAAYLLISQDPISLELLVGDDAPTELGALLHDTAAVDPEQAVMVEELRLQVEQMVDALPDRERAVIKGRLGLDGQPPQVLQEIGRALKLSRERVRQIELSAMRHLRDAARARNLVDLLSD